MVTVHWYSESFTAAYAVNLGTDIILYDENYGETGRITNLTYRDAPFVSIEGGEWTDAGDIPSDFDRLKAQQDFDTMRIDFIEEQLNGGTE